jgi:ABC-type branched-subunit amino acid transport system substrate-binding protein
MPTPGTLSIARRLRRAAGVLLLLPALAGAQILIGQTSGFSGPVAAGVKETTDGARLWIDAVNARGGIGGQRIELISLDDKFEPPLAAANAKKLIVERGVIAIFLNRGTPHSEAIRPLLEEFRVPMIAPSTGAMVLHRPVHPLIFNVRATYQREAEKSVQHLATIGVTRIAVLHVDDSFGTDAATGAAKGFTEARLQPALVAKFNRAKPEFKDIAADIVKKDAQAVLFFGSGQAVVDGMKAIRAAGSKAQVVTLSNNASGGFVKLLGDMARGTIVTQVFPNERAIAVPLVKEATDLAKAKGLPGITPAMLEGFAAAKVLVEGLQRAGARPTRESLTAALNGISGFDLGGLKVSYSPTNHTGLTYAELSIIGADGRFVR